TGRDPAGGRGRSEYACASRSAWLEARKACGRRFHCTYAGARRRSGAAADKAGARESRSTQVSTARQAGAGKTEAGKTGSPEISAARKAGPAEVSPARAAALMRIVAGNFRGRVLKGPSSNAIRPTSDRLRESVFNILVHAYSDPITGARVLDLFAGTGALGLEA